MDLDPVLVCAEGSLAGRVFPITDKGLRVGRSPDCDVVIPDDDGVSRLHATFTFDNGKLWVRDVGSRNGVFVNGKRIPEHKELSVGHKVAVGDTVFVVRWGDEVAAPASDASSSAANPEPERAGWRRYWPF